nr:hypothetical protein [Tanacetum cinerariifolium]
MLSVTFLKLWRLYRINDYYKVRDVKWDKEFGCQNIKLQLVCERYQPTKINQPFSSALVLGEIINYVTLLQLHVKMKKPVVQMQWFDVTVGHHNVLSPLVIILYCVIAFCYRIMVWFNENVTVLCLKVFARTRFTWSSLHTFRFIPNSP